MGTVLQPLLNYCEGRQRTCTLFVKNEGGISTRCCGQVFDSNLNVLFIVFPCSIPHYYLMQ